MKPTDRVKFMMSYNNKKTLKENLEEIKIIEEEETNIDEAGIGRGEAKDITKLLKGGATEAEMIATYAKTFGMSEDAVKLALAKDLTTLDKDIVAAVKTDGKNGVSVGSTNTLGPAAKSASKAKAIKEIMSRGGNITDQEIIAIIERTKNESKAVARKVEGSAAKSAATRTATKDAKKIGELESKIKELESIKSTQQAESAIKNEININMTQGGGVGTHAAVQGVKEIAPEAKIAAEESKTLVGTMKSSKWEKFKRIAGRLKPKYWIMLGLAGIGGWYLWKFFKSGTTKPENELFGKCLDDVIDDAGTTIKNTTGGDPVVVVKKTGNSDFDSNGGLLFYNNGRVFMGNQSKRGTWSCKGTKTVIAEQGDGNPNTGIGNINIVWDGEKAPVKVGGGDNGGGTKKGGGSSKSNVNYHDCSSKDFPLEFGCVSPKVAEIQKCLGITPQKGNFGPKTKKGLEDLHFDLTSGITKEIYGKVISACKPASTTGTTSPSTTGTTSPSVTGTTTPSTTGSTATAPITPPPTPIEPVFDKNRLQELLASKNLVKKRKGVIVKWKGPELEGNDYYILNKYLEDMGYIQKKQRETGDRDDEDVTMKYKWKLQGEE